MNDEVVGQYRIIGYIDELEEAERRLKANNLGDDLYNKIDEIHDSLVDLQPFLATTEDNDKLKEYVEDLIGQLVIACGEGKVDRINELLGPISEKVATLKDELD